MAKFFAGLACAFVGFIAWFCISIFLGIETGVTGEELTTVQTVALAIPFLLMVGGPVVFWIVLPLGSAIMRRRKS